ncbi:cation transporter [Strigomonas culicis]|uniref:Cation transporter n=1 Tax=Strigomonas culicis TaxID=28005 RepID=S9VVQ2_9TRYP|nr:cation transporter [Strigomonas culicis]|eukprot:EPY27485.1 cation transporter [Strigomonas culicis]
MSQSSPNNSIPAGASQPPATALLGPTSQTGFTPNMGSFIAHDVLEAMPSTGAHAPPRPMEIAESIKTLHEIHQSGGLTNEEFQQAKQQILDSSSSSSDATKSKKAKSSSKTTRSHHGKRHHRGSGGKSTKTSSHSSSSDSSSSSSSDHFIIVPRAKVWRTLKDDCSFAGDTTDAASMASPVYAKTEVIPVHEDTPLLVDLKFDGQTAVVAEGRPLVEATKDSAAETGSRERAHGEAARKEKGAYSTFARNLNAAGSRKRHVEMEPDTEVHVTYYNSRGASSPRFSEVELKPEELRDPIVQMKMPRKSHAHKESEAEAHKADLHQLAPEEESAHPKITPEEEQIWDEFSERSSSSHSSAVVQSLNWYWVDVTGRDMSRRRYDVAMRYLTRRFNLCESFLVDRDHMLVLPQLCESPNYPGQYLLNLRVATHKIAISDDSVLELTNRWIVIIDLHQHIIITIHRIDTHSMAMLRSQWSDIMRSADVSFQEFLLKIIDDAISTYQLSLDVHADLLDRCESKLFVAEASLDKRPTTAVGGTYAGDLRILHHFSGSSRSPFLCQILDSNNSAPIDKGQMNSFLHHLHRRTSVQHRMLNLNQLVLSQAFTTLRLCSKELATQLCGSCIELSDRALEIRDDAKVLLDLHLSLQTFRTSELMAVLTKVSMFFTPCTFLAGVYGMNFQHNFPEITWEYGYLFFWIMCGLLVIGMQLYFFRTV